VPIVPVATSVGPTGHVSVGLKASRYSRAIHPRRARFGDLSPSSISRRMASDKDGSSGRLRAQRSMRPRKSSETRTPIIGVTPVAGRPRFFCLALFIDFAMNLCLA
jgi:hypothetical protein